MKYFLFVTIFIISKISDAQLNYIEYHKKIIQAENFMLATDMKACIAKYKETFDAYPKTFARDAFTALQIACIGKDTASISYFFGKSVSNGIIWEAILYSKHYKDVVDYDLKFKRRLEALYVVSRKHYESSIDTSIRKFVLGLLEKDDSARFINHQQVKDSLDIVRWFEVMEHNIYQIDSLVKKIGFPSEHKAGILSSKIINVGYLGVDLYPTPSRIFYHNQCGFQLMKNQLLQAIIDGELTPKEYAVIQEWSFDVFDRKNGWERKYYSPTCKNSPGIRDIILPWVISSILQI